MKGLILGLAAGMAAGALLSANFSEVRKLAKKAGEAVSMGGKPQSAGKSDCECGEDCGCGKCDCEEEGGCRDDLS